VEKKAIANFKNTKFGFGVVVIVGISLPSMTLT
jgi:hypothetical protein